jgi:hypothetical protein
MRSQRLPRPHCRHATARAVALSVMTLIVLLSGFTSSAYADGVSCRRAVAKASAQFAQAKMKALQKCEDQVLTQQISGPCPGGAIAPRK